MKKSNLLEVIRKVVRKEVRLAIREELSTKQPSQKPEFNQMMEHVDGLFNKPETQNFSDDPVLNDILNETANAKSATSSTNTEWPTMGGRQFEKSDAGAGSQGLAAMMGMQSPNEMFGGQPTAQQMVPNDRKHVEIQPEVEQALTRDYSSLMAAINKKKGK